MAPSRGIVFALAALLVSSLLVITLTYGTARFGLPVDFRLPTADHQNEHNSVMDHLAITLHPGDHVLRGPEIVSFRWNITKGYRSPDGVKKLVYLINGSRIGRYLRSVEADFM